VSSVQIPNLPAVAGLDGSELFESVQGGTSVKVSLVQINAYVQNQLPPFGTVDSVDVSGGATGLTTSGGPITTSGVITLDGTLNVGHGGTGATTLTGYVKGNGTSAMTASATIPAGDVSGLGTMATQNANAVAITGGTVSLLDTDFTLSDDIDPTKQLKFQVSNLAAGVTVTLTAPTISGTLVITSGSQSLSGKTLGNTNTVTLKDTNFTLQDDGDTTKQGKFDLSGVPTASTVTLSWPSSSGTLALNTIFTSSAAGLAPASGGGTSTFLRADGTWATPSGTVSSVNVSGGTTGLSFSGGPITSSGTITMSGTLAIANGGTGATSKAGAFDALSPMTSVGDLILGGASGTGTRLAIGANGYVLKSNGTTAAWAAATSGTVTSVAASGGSTGLTFSGSPITSSGTLTLGGTLDISAGGTGATSKAAAFDALSPMTTAGDIIIGGAAGSGSRLGIGSSGQVLTVSGGTAAWVTPGTGGTVTSVAASGGTTGLTFSGSPITTSGTLTLGGTLNVANGGTGAATLTGYVKGNGTSAFTASATIPNTDISGLGTMSTQNANAVAITGGSITILDNNFTLQDDGDPSKQLKFDVTGITAGTTRTLTAPNASGTIAILSLAQTFSASQTFSAATNTFGTSTATGTQIFAGGVTASGNTKTVQIGTGGAAGSTTSIFIGPGSGGAGTVQFNSGVTSVTIPTLTLTNALTVPNGGTGASTLTGYVKGNGTAAMTASATIPNTDITGLGTMSTQNASSVAITGGSIQNTTIGGVGVSAVGTFTTLTSSTNLIALGTSTLGTANTDTVYANGMVSFLGGTRENVYTVTSTTPDFNPNDGGIVQWNLSGNSTPASPTTWQNGQSITLRISDGTAYTINWTTMGVVWVGGTAPTLATTGYTIVVLFKIGGVIYGSLTGNVA